MRLLVASSFPGMADRIVARFNSSAVMHVEKVVSDLSQTYDFAEHNKPDCVLLSAELADCPEFELLGSMLKILKIGCIIVTIGPNADGGRRGLIMTEGFDRLPEEDLTEVALRKALVSGSEMPSNRSADRYISSGADYDKKRLILIGASTGGVDALLDVLGYFPNDCPPTLIVQHTGGRFSRSLIRLLDGCTAANVCAGVDGATIESGNVYLAPDDGVHLQIQPTRTPRILLSTADLVFGHRPSIDALFNSAKHIAKNVTAALLTGMGRDGAHGIAELRRAGAHTIGQDEASCVVYGMPRVAAELGGIDEVVPLAKMGPTLLRSAEVRARV